MQNKISQPIHLFPSKDSTVVTLILGFCPHKKAASSWNAEASTAAKLLSWKK